MIQIETEWIYNLAKFLGAVGVVSSFFIVPIQKKLKKQIERLKETEERAKQNERVTKAHQADIEESKKDRAEIRESTDKIQAMTLALLRTEILRLCETLISKGSTTCDDLESLEDLYEPYKRSGGNGLGETMYKKVKQLPTQCGTGK